MYRYMGLILVIVFTNSCGSKVYSEEKQIKKKLSYKVVHKRSGRQQCIKDGGQWKWEGDESKWLCINKGEKLEWDGEQNRWKQYIPYIPEELKRCLKTHSQPFIASDKLDVVIDQCRKLMWQTTYHRTFGRWVSQTCKDPLYGFTNWRIPTYKELSSIVDKNQKPAINKVFKERMKKGIDNGKFLTSSKEGPYTIKAIELYTGKNRWVDDHGYGRIGRVNILCVRNATQKDIDAVLKYKEQVVGSTNFKNAKFINGVIWEDQPVNAGGVAVINNNKIGWQKKIVEVDDFDECKSYCESLDLLGVKKWHIPTLMDYSQILYGGYEKFDHSARTKRGSGLGAMFIRHPYYFAVNKTSCKSKDDSDDCAYIVDLISKDFDTADGLHYYCRCALDVRDYNNAKQKAARQLDQSADKEDFDFYIKKFYLTNDVKLLKKAESLAHTRKQKAKLERAYIEYVGNYWKVFKLYSKDLTTKKINTTNDKFFFVAGISDYRKSKYKITLQRNPKAPFRLKYGKYKIPVEFTLNLTYNDISGIGSLKIGKFRNEKIKREVVFNLNPANGYKDTKVVDFGSVEYSQSGEVTPFIDVNSKIVDAKLESKIVSVE